MSVIGIDFGNDTCFIAVARQGGIETIANEYSLRATPSYVSFGEKLRFLGYNAKQQQVSNLKNTVYNFKRLLGKSCKDLSAQEEIKTLPYKVIEKDGGIGIQVQYLGEQKTFSPTQITAMLLTKLKHTAETALKIKVVDVVIGVPCFLDDCSRYAMMQAGYAAGLNILRLMNETTAVALAYGIYKQDLPAEDEKPRYVVFVDCGHSNLQVSAVAFHKGKLKVLVHSYDSTVGGRVFDQLMASRFSQEFFEKTRVDLKNYPKSYIRLLSECEKLKKQMSANSTALPLNIECLAEDRDFCSKMKRENVEEMAKELLTKVAKTLQSCLNESNLKLEDIHSVEVVGGSTRVPAIKHLIEQILKRTPSTTLNADEAVARGCALQCAILSPTFKVREFSITDVQPYAINLAWPDENGEVSNMEVFPRNHSIPFSKMLTLYRKEPFTIKAYYAAPSPSLNPTIGNFTIQDIAPGPDGEPQKVKFKVRITLHGLFTVASATMSEKKEIADEAAPMETDQPENSQEANATKESETQDQPMEDKSEAPKEEPEKKTKKYRSVDLPINTIVNKLDNVALNSIMEEECQMIQNDKLETERLNARNAVEEYVYEMRDKIYSSLEQYIAEDDRSKFSSLLNETEEWLYEDGENCARQVYVDKLTLLKSRGDPVVNRKREREEVPIVFERFLSTLQQTRKVLSLYQQNDEALKHLDAAEMEKVHTALKEKEQWVDQHMGSISVCSLEKDLPISSHHIQSEKNSFESLVHPIISKPKPAPPKVEEKPAAPTEEVPPPQQPPTTDQQEMDVD